MFANTCLYFRYLFLNCSNSIHIYMYFVANFGACLEVFIFAKNVLILIFTKTNPKFYKSRGKLEPAVYLKIKTISKFLVSRGIGVNYPMLQYAIVSLNTHVSFLVALEYYES